MADPKAGVVTNAEALSVPGATVGFCDADVSTTEETVDLSAYGSRYVKIYSLDADILFSFMETSTGSLDTGAAAVGTAGVPDAIATGAAGVMRVVPKKAPHLRYRTVTGSGATLRVIPA